MANVNTMPYDEMKNVTGFKWAPGDGPNITIGSWLKTIGSTYKDTNYYCNSMLHQPFFQWCGLTVAYCMTKAGIKPIFGPTPTDKFLYALAWLEFGEAVQIPKQGDVIVFDFGGGDHHVTLFESDLGNGYWACRGGNQHREVQVSHYPSANVKQVRRQGSVVPASLMVDAIAKAQQIDATTADDLSVQNSYPEQQVIAYAKTTITPLSIANTLVNLSVDVNVARAAYVLICNESASGRKGINNNYGGLQADAGRWSHEYDDNISATCVVVDSGGTRRRFLCFSDASNCFKMVTSLIKKRGLYVGGTTHFIISTEIETPSEWAVAYYKEWVKGRKDAEISPPQMRSLESLYRSAIEALPDTSVV